MTTPYQSPQAEQWRLMTAVQRVDKLRNTTSKLAELVSDEASEQEKTHRLLAHILRQADHLDESAMLTGATGESNELYNQARGKTIVLGTDNAQKLPVIAQVVASLLAGNQTDLNFLSEEAFAYEVKTIMASVGIDEAVFNIDDANDDSSFDDMLGNQRLAQVAVVGTLGEVQSLSAKLSKTDGVLTQVIAITDQTGLSEVFNPDYVHRFSTERVRTVNTTAIGGNASLIELGAG